MSNFPKEMRREVFDFLHNHSQLEAKYDLKDHVIVDKEDWLKARDEHFQHPNPAVNKILERAKITYHHSRRYGNTSWIIKAALRDDGVIIVVPDRRTEESIRIGIKNAIKASPWWLRLKWYFKGEPFPKVVCLSDGIYDLKRLPVVFDNSVMSAI